MTTDNSIRIPPNYDGFQPPGAGQSYVDGLSGLTVTRLSDAAARGVPSVATEYSSAQPFSGGLLLLVHHDHFGLWYADGNGFVSDLPLRADAEPRWSRTNPAEIYYLSGNELRLLNVATSTDTLVRKFQEYGRITGKGESDVSGDGDHLVLIGDDREVFVYRISADRKGSVLAADKPVESLYITASNGVLISWAGSGGIDLFDSSLVFQRKVFNANGHKDVAHVDGRDLMVITNSNENPVTLPDFQNAVVAVDLATGEQTGLLSLPWNLAVHISCTARYAYVDTYAPGNPAPGSPEWGRYCNEVIRVPLKGAPAERLAWHRSRPGGDGYTWQPRVVAAANDERVAWTSNMGGGPEDVYLLTLGLSAAPPPPPPPPPVGGPTPEPPPEVLTGDKLVAAMTERARPATLLTPDQWSEIYRQVSGDRQFALDPALYMKKGSRHRTVRLANWLQKIRTYWRKAGKEPLF